jgi:hypothetical protein
MHRELIDPSKHTVMISFLRTQTMFSQYLCDEVSSVIPFLQKLSQDNPHEDMAETAAKTPESILSEFQSPDTALSVGLLGGGSKVRAELSNPWINFMGELCEFASLPSRI